MQVSVIWLRLSIRSRSRPSFCPLNGTYKTPESFAVPINVPAGTPLKRPPRQFARPPVICNSYFACGFRPLMSRFVGLDIRDRHFAISNETFSVANNVTVPPSTRAPIRFEPSTNSTFGVRGSPLSPISRTCRKKSSFAGFAGETSTRHAAGTTARVFEVTAFQNLRPKKSSTSCEDTDRW